MDSDGEISEQARQDIDALLHRTFRPEFLNRIDEIVFYKPLTKESIRGIIDLLIKGLENRLEEKSLKLVVTDAAKEFIIEHSYDPMFGARPIKRYLQSNVETLIARTVLRGELHEGDTVTVDCVDGKLTAK